MIGKTFIEPTCHTRCPGIGIPRRCACSTKLANPNSAPRYAAKPAPRPAHTAPIHVFPPDTRYLGCCLISTCFLNNLLAVVVVRNCCPAPVESQDYSPTSKLGGCPHNRRTVPSSSRLQHEALPAVARRDFRLLQSHLCQTSFHTCQSYPAICSQHTKQIFHDRARPSEHLWHHRGSLSPYPVAQREVSQHMLKRQHQ